MTSVETIAKIVLRGIAHLEPDQWERARPRTKARCLKIAEEIVAALAARREDGVATWADHANRIADAERVIDGTAYVPAIEAYCVVRDLQAMQGDGVLYSPEKRDGVFRWVAAREEPQDEVPEIPEMWWTPAMQAAARVYGQSLYRSDGYGYRVREIIAAYEAAREDTERCEGCGMVLPNHAHECQTAIDAHLDSLGFPPAREDTERPDEGPTEHKPSIREDGFRYWLTCIIAVPFEHLFDRLDPEQEPEPAPECEVCGDERILMEPDGSKAQPCYACQPVGTTLEQASRPLVDQELER
jgi:hypothetical protein